MEKICATPETTLRSKAEWCSENVQFIVGYVECLNMDANGDENELSTCLANFIYMKHCDQPFARAYTRHEIAAMITVIYLNSIL